MYLVGGWITLLAIGCSTSAIFGAGETIFFPFASGFLDSFAGLAGTSAFGFSTTGFGFSVSFGAFFSSFFTSFAAALASLFFGYYFGSAFLVSSFTAGAGYLGLASLFSGLGVAFGVGLPFEGVSFTAAFFLVSVSFGVYYASFFCFGAGDTISVFFYSAFFGAGDTGAGTWTLAGDWGTTLGASGLGETGSSTFFGASGFFAGDLLGDFLAAFVTDFFASAAGYGCFLAVDLADLITLADGVSDFLAGERPLTSTS